MKDLPAQTLQALLNRIAHGDDKAASELYRHYHDYVFAHLRFRMADEQAAEEVADDVLLVVFRKPLEFDGRSKFTTWLLGIAYNKYVDWVRRKGRAVRVADVDDEVVEAVPDLDMDVVALVSQRQEAAMVRNCIDGLAEKHREAIVLAYYEDASMEEIADRLNCPPGTVKSRLSNARAKLLDCVSRWLGRKGS